MPKTDCAGPEGENSKVTVSLIIPCYNVQEDLVRRALESVQEQTFRNYEIIVVDDGSREDCQKALRQLCSRTEKTRLIRTENRGVSAARNTGILAARGTYIAFLDADDVLAADFLERAMLFQSKTDADAVIGGVVYTERPEDNLPSGRETLPRYTVYSGETVRELLPHLIGMRYRIHFPGGYIGRGSLARMIRTDLVKGCLFDETVRIGEDIIWNLQILNQCNTVCVVEECWYGYRKHMNSASYQYSLDFLETNRKGLEKLYFVIDRTDDLIYLSYMAHMFERLRKYWKYYLRTKRIQDRRLYRKAVASIYTEWPWTELGGKHFFRVADIRGKERSVLFHLKLYFDVVAIKENLRKKKKSIIRTTGMSEEIGR